MYRKGISRLSVWKKQKVTDKNCGLPGNIEWFDKSTTQLFAGKRLIQALGLQESDLNEDEQLYLPAPYEVLLSLPERRFSKCLDHSRTVDSLAENELNIDEIKKAIDNFAEMGVFRITFGGGEPFNNPDVLEIAKYAREKGIVPSIATNGFCIDENIAKGCRIFDRVNINIDVMSDSMSSSRGEGSPESVDRAVHLLKKNKASVGFNVVVSAESFTRLGEICEYANSKQVGDVALQRFKSFAIGIDDSNRLGLKSDHLKVLFPMIQRLTKRFGIKFHMDCSLFPSLAFHSIDSDTLSSLGKNGCGAGNIVAGMMSDGSIKACNFCPEKVGSVFEINSVWHTGSHFKFFRNWGSRPGDPCAFCRYLEICNGGCHAVAYYETGSYDNVDPACPIATDFKRGIIHPALSGEESV